MAGLRIVWVDDVGGASAPGELAKPAYRRLGKWAFEHNSKWIGFIDAADNARLHYLATKLREAFVNSWPSGAKNLSPRVLIIYDYVGPANLSDAGIQAYHNAHKILALQDGDDYSTLIFKGDPKTFDFEGYFGDYGTDEGEAGVNLARAQRMFAMSLMTRCR